MSLKELFWPDLEKIVSFIILVLISFATDVGIYSLSNPFGFVISILSIYLIVCVGGFIWNNIVLSH